MSVHKSIVLTDWFKYANRKFFKNKLPKKTFCYWNRHFFSREDTMGMCWHYDMRDCIKVKVGGRYETLPGPNIAIAWELHNFVKMTKLVLLHEMVHLKLKNKKGNITHGKVFDKEIQRLMRFKEVRDLI